jgi:Carboxypeptidase regulatory-like domain
MVGLCKTLGRLLGVILALGLFASLLLGQSGDVSLRGQVTDPSGAAIPSIPVTITGPGGAALEALTTREGRYAFHHLVPGTYALQISLRGFAPFEKTGIEIVAGKPKVVDAQLTVAMEKQEVTVQGEANRVSVSPENNVSALVLKGEDLKALSDDPDDLQNELEALAGPAAGPNGGEIYIDGFSGGQLPPKSEILQIRINQNPFSAEYDKLGYGRIEITTKPGYQKFHGQVFAFGNDSVLNSRNPFVAQEPGYHSEFYSGNVGGPLGKKAALFFDFFRRDINNNSIVSAITLDSNFNLVPFSQAVRNPQTRTHFNPRADFQLSEKNILTVRAEFSKDSRTNNGIGQFSLPSQAYNSSGNGVELHISDTQVLSSRTVNQTLFGYERDRTNQTALSLDPTLNVIGAFTGGGRSSGRSTDIQNRYELRDNASISLGKHNLTFGGRLRDVSESDNTTAGYNGTFTFPSLAVYQITEKGLSNGLTMTQIEAFGGGASQFVITAGNPLAQASLVDLALYGEDAWRLRPNISLTLGMRYEGQNHIGDHADFAPRVGLAWGLGHSARPKTVLRAGFGIFYDRFGENEVLQAERLNGINQQQYVVTSPDFFPAIPPLSTLSMLSTGATAPTVYQVDPALRAPYTMQAAIGLERQLSKAVTTSVTYINSHGVHQLLIRNINAPLPGTYNPANPASGDRPFGNVSNIYQYESDGLFNENQVIANFNVRSGAKLSLFGFYTLSYANSNDVGGGFPMNQYDIRADYGPAAFVVRNQAFVGGSFSMPWGFRLSPMMIINSGRPYNVTIGQDLNGDSLFNDRPAFAMAGATGPNIKATPFGTFNLDPAAGTPVIPINYLTGPSQFSMNMRLGKTFGFGKATESGGPGGGWHGHHEGGLGGRGLSGGGGGFFGPNNAENRRYQLELSVMAHNVFNHVNLGTPVGNLSSPIFGQSNSIAGGFFGGGAANRSLNLMVRFSF